MIAEFTFEGFDPANTTPVPDVFFDVLLPHLNEAQLKVMLYIIRRTLGFKKTEDAISLKQFRYGIITKDKKQLDEGCGLKNFTTISKALKSLEQMNCIEKAPSKTDAGDDATTVYRIHFRGTARNVVPTTDNVVRDYANRSTGTAPSGVGVLRETESQLNSITRNSLQETDRQEDGMSLSGESDAPALFIHPVYSFLAFDDLQHPTLMVITFIDDDRAEITNKSRGWIAHEVAGQLEAKGIKLQVRTAKEHVDDAVVDAPAANIHDLQKWKEESGKHKAISKDDLSRSHADIGNEETVKLGAVKIGGNNGRPNNDLSSRDHSNELTHHHGTVDANQGHPGLPAQTLASQQTPAVGARSLAATPSLQGSRQEDSPNVQAVTETPGAGIPSAVTSPHSQHATRQAPIPRRPRAKKPITMDEQPQPKCDTREIQQRINDHRGYALEEKVEIIRERQAIKTWCSLHTLEEYDTVMARLKQDRYWGKDENYYRIGGLTLLQQTSRMLAQRQLKAVVNGNEMPQEDDDYSDFDIYKGNGKEERAALRALGEEMEARGELIW